MARMSVGEIRAILDSEHASALSANNANKLSTDRQKAMNYYQGQMQADFPDEEGKSRAVSSDVSDTIDGMVPELVDMLCGTDEVVRFEPVSEQDVAAAQQETDYVNHVFMQENPGFLILLSYIKDAILQKTGTMKVSWETREEEVEEVYSDLTDQQFDAIVATDGITLLEHTIKDAPGDGPDNTPETDTAYN